LSATIDWERVTAEATEILRAYLRIDTSNPPGNEQLAVDYLSGLLESEGVAYETAESAPGRANLFAWIGPREPNVCLLNHTDVVPVERPFWDTDPFAGDLRDGVLWGRGALDMKGMGVIELMALLLLKRQRVPLKRGVTFLAVADEEAGSELGMAWVERNRPEWMNTDLVINEGAYGLSGLGPDGAQVFQVAPGEKIPVWVRLRARGRPGHGSVPHGDNCADRLVLALSRVAGWQQGLRVTPLMRAHLDAMARFGAIKPADDQGAIRLAERSPAVRARLGNTISLTTISTGIKVNVIPAEATATLDCRLLPDEDVDAFLERLQATVDDPRVELEVLNRADAAQSPLENELLEAVAITIGELVEGAGIAPELTSGFTDSRIYRTRGIPAYGFVPCLVPPEDLAGVHGHNERITVENLRLGVQVLYEVLRRLCAA
jgi:acetylornithine deacetylase/succinyl-diaminopimelate desuccinylase-like protein